MDQQKVWLVTFAEEMTGEGWKELNVILSSKFSESFIRDGLLFTNPVEYDAVFQCLCGFAKQCFGSDKRRILVSLSFIPQRLVPTVP